VSFQVVVCKSAACIVCGEGDPLDDSISAAEAYCEEASKDHLRPGLRAVEIHTGPSKSGGNAHLVDVSDGSDDDGFAHASRGCDGDDGASDEEAAPVHWACLKCDRRLKRIARQRKANTIFCGLKRVEFVLTSECRKARRVLIEDVMV